MSEYLIECIGWAGSVLVLAAYFLVSTGRVSPSSPLMQWLNLSGSVCLIVITLYKPVYQSAVVNIIWAGVAVYGLMKARIHKAGEKQ